ncbi:hypothetical protein EKK58_06185 [Candidatus Dependentiae bacterium]|nr:MAG: hypothetical protein EKK58_06185 [Candidatus Dependentiae bacterium]
METNKNINTPYDSSVVADNDPVFNYIQTKKNSDRSYLTGQFLPNQSANINRNIYREPAKEFESSSVQQSIGEKQRNPVENANNYLYLRTTEFPQPSIAGIGSVTSAGAVDTTRYFFPQNWTISKIGSGQYRITHQMGDGKYNVVVTPINTAGYTSCLSNFGATSFQINTFNSVGAGADCAFTFVVYIIT